jgi:hypothetical protein
MYVLNRMFTFGYLHRMNAYFQQFLKRNRRHSYPLSKLENENLEKCLCN